MTKNERIEALQLVAIDCITLALQGTKEIAPYVLQTALSVVQTRFDESIRRPAVATPCAGRSDGAPLRR